jgi:uncharacterized membrane protein
VLPQVLAGLGLLSLVSASCLFWLQRLQLVFLTIALGSLGYEGWLVRRQLPALRTRGVKAVLGASLIVNMAVLGSWVVLWFRYR